MKAGKIILIEQPEKGAWKSALLRRIISPGIGGGRDIAEVQYADFAVEFVEIPQGDFKLGSEMDFWTERSSYGKRPDLKRAGFVPQRRRA